MFERAKFYSLHDLGNTIELRRVQKVLDAYNPGLSYDNVNDVMELYNVKLFIDNGLALKAWDDKRITSYVSLVSGFGKDIVSYFRNTTNLVALLQSLNHEYHQDFWDVFEKFGLLDLLSDDVMKAILEQFPNEIENILHCEIIVKQNDEVLADFLRTYIYTSVLLVNAYYVKDMNEDARKLFIPKSLTDSQRERIIDDYLSRNTANLGTVRIIMQSRDVDGLKLNPKIRLKARRLEPSLATIPEGTMVSAIQTGFSIEFKRFNIIQRERQWIENLIWKFEYNENYLDSLDDTKLLESFRNLFSYFYTDGLIALSNDRNQDNIFEKVTHTEVKGVYLMNDISRMRNNIAVSQLAMFDGYLRRKGKNLEGLIKKYYEEHLKEYYGYPAPSLSMPKDDDTYANKNKCIAPEMEAVIKQYSLYVEEGEIDPELLEMEYSLPIALGKSLLNGKHKYAVIKEGSNAIYNPLFMMFSDQSLLSFIEPYKESGYHSLFDLLKNVGRVPYNNYEEHQRPRIDFLIEIGLLAIDNGMVCYGNVPRVSALSRIWYHKEISYYHCEPEVKKEVDKMVDEGWLKYDDYLLSPEERHYINFYLNSVEYSNGLQLRNRYSHGATSCINGEAEHRNAYYYFLMIFVILLLKIDEDLSINAFLNAQLENNNGAEVHIMTPGQQYG